MSFAMETTKVARSHNYDTLLLVHDDALAGMRRSAATQLADGIVVLDVDENDARVPLARTLACPTVFVGLPADTEGLICVDLDFEAAARTAIDRLVETGHRQIGLISHRRETLDRGSNFPRRFLRAFEDHAAALGIEVAVAHPGGHTAQGSVRRLRERLPELDAIVLNTTADVASSLTSTLATLGLETPRDVSVVAAGVSFSTARFAVPFDTMPLDARASCTVAVDLLVQAIDGGDRTPRIVLIPPTYIDQGSVATRAAQPSFVGSP
jgi:DNA-binding LacI/PurR family transcriptional regulator